MDLALRVPHPPFDGPVIRGDSIAVRASLRTTNGDGSGRSLEAAFRVLGSMLGPAAFLLLGACIATDASDPDPEPGPPIPVARAEAPSEPAPPEASSPVVHWQTDRIGALELLRDLVALLPVRMVEPADRPEAFVVGNWRREATYALVDGRFSELQARERPIDFPSHAWFFTQEGTFRRTTERFAWSGRVTWPAFGPDEPTVPGWRLLELEEMVTSPWGLPFGDRQLALVGFVEDAMLLILWEDTRRNPPDLVWRFVRYAGVAG